MSILQECVTKREINGTEMHIKCATGEKQCRMWKHVHIIQDTMNGYVLG